MKSITLKVFSLTALLTLCCMVLAAYAGKRAFNEDPKLLTKLGQNMGFEINDEDVSFQNFHLFDEEAANYAEVHDQWKFKIPLDKISVKLIDADVEMGTTSGEEIIVEASGLLDQGRAQHILNIDTDTDELTLKQVKGRRSKDVKVKLLLPATFAKKLEINSVSGSMQAENLKLEKLELETVSGTVFLKVVNAAKLQIASVSGDITSDLSSFEDAKLNSVSGNVSVLMPNTEKITFSLKSMSGSIHNEFSDSSSEDKKMKVETVSGDIEIKKLN